MDGEAGSPARCRASNLRFEPSAVSPKAKPETPKGFQPSCHPLQSPLKIKDFSGAETARKRFFLWKMGFSGAKIAPCPPYTPLGTIESSKGLRPSRALRGFFDSLTPLPFGRGGNAIHILYLRIELVQFGEVLDGANHLRCVKCTPKSGHGKSPNSYLRTMKSPRIMDRFASLFIIFNF